MGRRVKKVTKAGKHGTLTLYSITYSDEPYDPGFGTAKVRVWAYDREHAVERFYEGEEGWRAVGVTEVRR